MKIRINVGILTEGGDSPGLNPAIHGAVLRVFNHEGEIIEITRGRKGLVDTLLTTINK